MKKQDVINTLLKQKASLELEIIELKEDNDANYKSLKLKENKKLLLSLLKERINFLNSIDLDFTAFKKEEVLKIVDISLPSLYLKDKDSLNELLIALEDVNNKLSLHKEVIKSFKDDFDVAEVSSRYNELLCYKEYYTKLLTFCK